VEGRRWKVNITFYLTTFHLLFTTKCFFKHQILLLFMKQALVILVFLLVMLALAGSAHAASSNSSVTTITISVPVDDAFITQGATLSRKEAKVNFTYISSTENNISWCRLIVNGSQMAVNPAVDANKNQHFNDIGLTNGSWWYYLQCRDNYSNIFNSTNKSLRVVLDDVNPTILPSNSESTYNTSTGMAVFKFVATDYESGITNCTLVVNDETRGEQTTVPNGSLTSFAQVFLPEGDYTWWVLCRDTVDNVGKSTHGMFVAELRTSQVITLTGPPNNALDLDKVVTFKYQPVSRLPINWCVLKLNETFNVTNTSVVNNTENSFDKIIVDGVYNWSVSCMDSSGYVVNSTRWSIYIPDKILVSEYLNINVAEPEDWFFSDTGEVTIKYTPTATLGLDRCELVTNGSLREVYEAGTSGEQATFTGVSFSEGTWEWRVRCFDNSENEYNSKLYNLVIKQKKPELILEPPPEEIAPEVEGANITDILDTLAGKTKSLLGISNAAWVTMVIVILMLGIGAVVIVVDKKFELELIRDVERILYKLKIRKEPPGIKRRRTLTDEHKKALKSYISYHMRNGVPRANIEAHLKVHKWRDEHVKAIFEELEKDWDELREKLEKK